ncbi:MAG: radical SAM family heme chaperone HemW [Desulfobulbaceae bacterium]|nr:MAG: radical SAM family heme chaperone HemW [Desulfobulbaceae bacterium]
MSSWLVPASLYIHIPFCQAKCHYCSFNSYPAQESLHAPYLKAVKKELVLQKNKLSQSTQLRTIFFGGGTPAVIGVDGVIELLSSVLDCFRIAENCEISIETNPELLEIKDYQKLVQSGINRLSIGIQSFIDTELALLGRIHSASKAEKAYEMARMAGFDNINLDLMYGIPGQTPGSWVRSITVATKLNPEHLSLYQLSIEEGTEFENRWKNKLISLPSEEEISSMDRLTKELCPPPYEQYEISNYARGERRCKHNITYWKNHAYLGVGAGAVSYIDGVRMKNIEVPRAYCEHLKEPSLPVANSERLERYESFKETVIMGLRLREGVELGSLKARYNLTITEVYTTVLDKLLAGDMLRVTDTHLQLTERGWSVSNLVMADLV